MFSWVYSRLLSVVHLGALCFCSILWCDSLLQNGVKSDFSCILSSVSAPLPHMTLNFIPTTTETNDFIDGAIVFLKVGWFARLTVLGETLDPALNVTDVCLQILLWMTCYLSSKYWSPCRSHKWKSTITKARQY